MTKIVLDAPLRAKLLNLSEPLELCDESGEILGRFIPRLDPSRYNLQPQISREELQRRKESTERTYTTAEVLAYLEQL